MVNRRKAVDIPPGGLDTPYGRLYEPLGQGRQVAVLAGAFFAGPALGWLVGQVPGDLSETAVTIVQVHFVVVFFIGYTVWVARLNAIAFDGIGRSLFKALFTIIVLRRKPASVEEVLPSREKLTEMMVRAQKAGGSFVPVSWLVGLGAGAAAMLFDSSISAPARFALVASSVIAWGYALGWLGRRGWLPFMEEG
jgi:hypothetical protein